MYRAVTLAVLQQQLDPGDENRVAELAQDVEIDVRLRRFVTDGSMM